MFLHLSEENKQYSIPIKTPSPVFSGLPSHPTHPPHPKPYPSRHFKPTFSQILKISVDSSLSNISQLINITMQKPMIKKEQKKIEPPPILQFKGYYQFLSIDYTCWVYYQGFMFPSVATAFQAARTSDAALRRRISEVNDQEQLKQIMTEIKNTPDWPQRRIKVMQQLNRDKFKRNKDLGLKLFATQSRRLVNGYEKGGDAQTFWGAIEVKGEYQGLNTLGKILTTVREEIHHSKDSQKWIEDQNVEPDANLWPMVDIIVQHQDGSVDTLPLRNKGRFIFGWADQCDFKLPQSSSSKYHAGIYYSTDMQAVIVDLNSSQGVRIRRGNEETKLQPLRPQSLEKGDVVTFGSSLSRYTMDISYELVQARLNEKKLQAMKQLQRIESIKKLESQTKKSQERLIQERNSIKALLQLKQFSSLYVQGINRNFTYKDIKETFNQYGLVKNIRINIEQKTGKFMGSVLVFFDEKIKISEVLQNIKRDPIKFEEFRVVAVTSEEAEKIIATFTNKDAQQKHRKQAEQNQRARAEMNERAREKEIPKVQEAPKRRRESSESGSSSSSRSRSSGSSSSSSSSSSSRSRSRSRRRR